MTIQEKLNDFKGSQIIGIDTTVSLNLLGGKSNPMQGKVQKVTEGNVVMIFKSPIGYANMVNRRLAKQIKLTGDLFERITGEDFTPGPRPWGHRIPDTPFVQHKGKIYLECIFLRRGKSKYYLDGTIIKKSDIIGLREKTEGAQGGLRDKVIIRTFDLNSIIKVRKGKEEILGPRITRN